MKKMPPTTEMLLYFLAWKFIRYIKIENKRVPYTVKLDFKELLNKEKIDFKELFTDYQLFYTIYLLLNKEHLPI